MPSLSKVTRKDPASRQLLAVLLLLAAIGGFQIATIRAGHVWGDDFAMYIQQAKNFAEGAPYTQSGYIYNPHNPSMGPRTYPPLYPLMLAPVYRAFGFDLTAMKVEGVFCFLLALLGVYLLFADELPFPDLFLLIAVLGFNPYFWQAKDRVGSDLPFFALCIFTLYLMILMERHGWNGWGISLLLGLLMYFCYATRTVGAVLPVSLILYEIVRHRRISRSSAIAVAVAGVLIGVQALRFPGAESYADQIRVSWQVFSGNVKGYFWELHTSLWPFYRRYAAWAVTLLLLGLGVAGYLSRVRSKPSVLEVFVVIYMVIVLFWPAGTDARFIIPVIPLWLYYVFSYVRLIASRYVRSGKYAAPAILVVLFTLSYASGYSQADLSPIRQGIGDPRFLEACDYVKAHTDPGAVILFSKPRLLALMTGRRAGASRLPAPDAEIWNFVQSTSAGYILVGSGSMGDLTDMRSFIDRQGQRVQLLFQNSGFALYRIL